jgi:hypothetical protein
MTMNSTAEETTYAFLAVSFLRDILPSNWQVEAVKQATLAAAPSSTADWLLRLTAPNGTGATLPVEERKALSPREASTFLPPIAQRVRLMSGGLPLLLVAPWLSRRTQELLAIQDVNYIDLTGNVFLSLGNPPLFIKTEGAARNPHPKQQGRMRFRGPKAGRLIRFLLDVAPPYTAKQLVAATGLTPGYVSRLLDALHGEALLERPERGPVESVDVANLVRRWAEAYDVFESNETLKVIAPAGSKALLQELKVRRPQDSKLVVSGSFAATAMAPITAPALLIGYCDKPAELAQEFDLLPSDEGSNVILMKPYDQVVWQHAPFHGGLSYASPPQVAVDCLTGNGRMPEEGEALLDWMVDHEPAWRASSIDRKDRLQ